MPMKFETVADRRAYWRARYWKNREAVLARRRAQYAAADPETTRAKNRENYLRHREQLLAHQREVRAANREERRERDRHQYRLRVYGTATPDEGQLSLDGTHRFMNYGNRITHPKPPPKPRKPRVVKVKAVRIPRTPGIRVAPVIKTQPAPPPPRPAPPPIKRDPWIPQPVSRWEPGLERVAS